MRSLLLAGSGGPASQARFGVPHPSFGRFVLLLCSAPSEFGWPLLVGVYAFFWVVFLRAPLFLAFSGFWPWVSWALALLASSPPPPFSSWFSALQLWFVLFPPPPLSLFFVLPCFGWCPSGLVFVSCPSPLPPPPPVFCFPLPPLCSLVFFMSSALSPLVGVSFLASSFSVPPPPSLFLFVAACLVCCLFPGSFASSSPPPLFFFCLLDWFPCAPLFLLPAPLPLSFVFLYPPLLTHPLFFFGFRRFLFWLVFVSCLLAFPLPPPSWCLFPLAPPFLYPAPLPLFLLFSSPPPPRCVRSARCSFWSFVVPHCRVLCCVSCCGVPPRLVVGCRAFAVF